ncbi:hypothetical protein SAMN05518848_10895 [Paenibacillus sp. PDC88]|nr:hypothetical protein SAMN05518848_10895 [Paenibacillus sp. PDC88]
MSWFFAGVFWLVSLSAFLFGLNLTRELHKSTDYSVSTVSFHFSNESPAGWFLGVIFSSIPGLIIGFFSILPWWLARTVLFGISIIMFLLGINVLKIL